MANKQAVNTFIKGMSKDLDKSVMSENSYLNADNFRITTSEGASSGALENIKGNKWLGVDAEGSVDYASFLAPGQFICGSVRVRDYIILFTTNNIYPSPNGGRSMLYKLILNKITETVTSLTVLYDDSLNASAGTLNFSIANKIKAVAKYESPNIQKVYWTDGYNNLRYADVAKDLTITGSAYTLNDYMAPEMFEFLPLFVSSKPTLSTIVGGHLMSGMVQYAYQLYRLNGAETAFSAVSDMIHIVTDNDFGTNTLHYQGDDESVKTGKGCKLSIVNSNTGYDRLRLIRLHYSTLNSIPVINVVAEIEIGVSPSTVTITDIGENVSELTLDEFNISSTELFKCEDIAIKGNRLFAANIEKDEFTVDDWDARAVRFRSYTDPTPPALGTDTVFSNGCRNGYSGVVFDNYTHVKKILITIPDITTILTIPAGRTVADITAIATTRTSLLAVDGEWHESDHTAHYYSSVGAATTFTVISFDSGTGELIFTATTTGTAYLDLALYDHMSTVGDGTFPCDIFDIVYTYSYTTLGVPTTYTDAIVYNGINPTTIDVPADPNNIVDATRLASWDSAGWDNYTYNHDGINKFNDTDNDGVGAYGFKYQSNGTTVGAEGPNIKIDFETEVVELDSSNSATTFSCGISASESYTNFASPWMDGKLSFQRDETYRYFVVWANDRGQKAAPQWVIDLRMPSLHDTAFTNSSSLVTNVYPNSIANQAIATGVVYTGLLRPRIYFKSKPANAVSCQIYRVKRERDDRSVVTQSLVIPTKITGIRNFPDAVDQVNLATDGIELVKLVSPEINVSKNIVKQSNDYLEYVTHYTGAGVLSTTSTTGDLNRYTHKLVTNSTVPYVNNVKTDINESLIISPAIEDGAEYSVKIDGKEYTNMRGTTIQGRGCTGLLVSYDNTSWSAEGVAFCIANYKSKVFGSQYGGNTYENRALNISIPCSDVISTIDVWHSIKGGDTFINYFDVSTLLYDLLKMDLSHGESEVVYVPLESSINCDLRHDLESQHLTYNVVNSALRQEYSGLHVFIDTVGPITLEYSQLQDLYLYNTVYSQQTSAQYAISEMLDTSNETVFDCLVKASNVKYNGENTDSWTKFNVNEEIEVDSNYGEVRAIGTFNEKLLYWQEDAFGILSVNDRSLIQDSSSAQLVLGTGGVLSRYDYISDTIGILDNHCLVYSDNSVYWFYDKDTSIYRFNNKLDNLTKDKGLWSWFKTNYSSLYSIHGIYDRAYNEVIYTLYKLSETGYTIAFNEQTDQFTSFYSFVPRMYIDYKDGYLSVKGISQYLLTSNLDFKYNSGYGYLYNYYAAIGDIAPIGFHVPSSAELETLSAFLGGAAVASGPMKETGFSTWTYPNTGATNTSGFNAMCIGFRAGESGIFHGSWVDNDSALSTIPGWFTYWWSTTSVNAATASARGSFYSTTILTYMTGYKSSGYSIRCIADEDYWITGDTVMDYDGNVYDVVKIGTQAWLVQNLMTTHYNDGTLIPEVTDNTAWTNLTTGAMCYYNNDLTYSQYGSVLWQHNSNIESRCKFYSLTGEDEDRYASTIKLLYNNDYPITKVFDNVFYISNAYDEDTDVDQYSTTFDQVRCYDDYQNSGWVDLVYPINIMRRERGWSITVPRNLLEVDYTSSPDIFTVANIDTDATKVWHERIRDKYMVLDLSFDNTSGTRFVVPFIGLKYRLSYR